MPELGEFSYIWYDILGSAVTDSDNHFGYWSYIRHQYYYSCSGSESSLTSCSNRYTYHYCYPNSDAAGVRCANSGITVVS